MEVVSATVERGEETGLELGLELGLVTGVLVISIIEEGAEGDSVVMLGEAVDSIVLDELSIVVVVLGIAVEEGLVGEVA